MAKPAKFLALTIALCISTASLGQNLTLSWQSDATKDFGQQSSGTITINLIGTNPLFYTYATDIIAANAGQDDAAKVINANQHAAAFKAAAAPDPCVADAAAVETAIKTKLTRPGTPPKSIPYAQSVNEWNTNVAGLYATIDAETCNSDPGKTAKAAVETAHANLFPSNGVPTFVATIQAVDCKKYTVTFREFYLGQASSAQATATFTTPCDQLTLSAGTILTELPSPTYSSVTDPANTQQQRLSIQNTGGLRPTIVGLMNYNIWSSNKYAWPGFAVSTGPVFQNAQSNASVFGWYLGGSVSVFKRLFITLGEHWGQVPGTPYGLTEGSIIPSNYGQLNPQLRYSGRFALGITFQTTSISTVGQQSTAPSVAAQPAGK